MVGHIVWDAVEVSGGVLACVVIWSGIIAYVSGIRARVRRSRG